MAGRKPKPTHLKVLQGNPGNRPLNDSEPKPEAKIPTCPSHLQGEARREWFRMSKKLHALGLMTEIDKAALATYCSCWGRYVRAEEELSDLESWVSETDNGYQFATVWIQISNQAMKQMKGALVEFGMTPSARSRVNVDKPEPENPFEQFLNKRAS